VTVEPIGRGKAQSSQHASPTISGVPVARLLLATTGCAVQVSHPPSTRNLSLDDARHHVEGRHGELDRWATRSAADSAELPFDVRTTCPLPPSERS
jgi:hypothetical protein